MVTMNRDTETVHEAYAFVCLHCGHGWEEEYEIRHSTDLSGHRKADYYAHGVRVASPLTRADCPACNRGPIRILRPGRVNVAHAHLP
ncbi:hypothetical protein EYS09_30680 [Streptomyces kasugaensis]|uniref:C2H2-type domain-containing protein n=2 Tax=Streptomyces TaxID=1883 RepID=A0A4Q9HM86_STRKA|nr:MULTISPECIES: hypothetical protein [Streptomyces]MYU51756.1 hypothetical protein [Streptomyces sp. SID7805]TBO55924.1 hypothetical protein EYS09_30680 [Streptomyces kasugaensis]WSK17725.1 hypothetical protein OG717_32610 [Streptomyces celluloflavus]